MRNNGTSTSLLLLRTRTWNLQRSRFNPISRVNVIINRDTQSLIFVLLKNDQLSYLFELGKSRYFGRRKKLFQLVGRDFFSFFIFFETKVRRKSRIWWRRSKAVERKEENSCCADFCPRNLAMIDVKGSRKF